LTVAAEGRSADSSVRGVSGPYGFIDEIVGSFGQVMPARKHRIGLKGAS
jgi:hypothetical protein